MEKNENVKMEVVLENTNESLDLFQNPTIKKDISFYKISLQFQKLKHLNR